VSPPISADTVTPSFPHGNYYRHLDGGVYQLIARGTNTETGEKEVTYLHLFPYEPECWVRLAELFDGQEDGRRRFAPISREEARAAFRGDPEEARAQVAAAKADRRHRREATPPAGFTRVELATHQLHALIHRLDVVLNYYEDVVDARKGYWRDSGRTEAAIVVRGAAANHGQLGLLGPAGFTIPEHIFVRDDALPLVERVKNAKAKKEKTP
jgi:hypothetical protein